MLARLFPPILRTVVLLVPINILLIFIIYYYNITGSNLQIVSSILDKVKWQNTPEWQYLSEALDNGAEPVLERDGFQLKPTVQFKYLNKKNKRGNAKEILEIHKNTYARTLEEPINEPKDFDIESIRPPEDISNYKHANATILIMARNTEVSGLSRAIKKFEKSFNSKFKYPYTFLNDEPFNDRFKRRMRLVSDAPMTFSQIPSELWNKPSSIDEDKEKKAMEIMAKNDVAYAQKQSYHNMCRFYLMNFYNVPELQKFKYYWRIEPNVDFYSNINYDIFKYLEGTNKIYGFTINLYDIEESVATLWPETLKYLNEGENSKYVNRHGAFQWLLNDKQNPQKIKVAKYSTCHFWSNFEIGDMDFYRGDAYNEWVKYLDSTGKFYYERWGDAPVHSMGLALFADKRQIHWFRDIGYFHDPYVNCPNSEHTSRCKKGEFSRWEHLATENCMPSWIDYEIANPSAIY